MELVLEDFKKNVEKTVSLLKEDIRVIRTGRATPALVEGLQVETYNGQAKLKLLELASIITEGPATLVIVPFDVQTIPDIERAILKSALGLTPQTKGHRIDIKVPSLSQEQREKLIKFVKQKVEEKRQIIRNHRDETRKKLRILLDTKEINEDIKFRAEKEIDNISQKSQEEIQRIKENKEKEIQEV